MSKKRNKKRPPKRVLALPNLEQSKAAVLNSLTSKSSQRAYARAITDFVDWYCSEPRLALNRTVVLRNRIYLEQKHYAATTINLRLAAFRRVAFESKECGGSEPASEIGSRPSRAKRLLAAADRNSLRGTRNYAILAMLTGRGLRRAELLGLRADALGLREEH